MTEHIPNRRVHLVLRFRGVEFTQWKPALDHSEAARIRHGALGHRISRSVIDPSEYLAVVAFTSHGGALGYADDPDRYSLERAVTGRRPTSGPEWDESIHELIDVGEYL